MSESETEEELAGTPMKKMDDEPPLPHEYASAVKELMKKGKWQKQTWKRKLSR